MVGVIRAEVTFDNEDYARAKQAAKNEGISFAEYVRRAVRRSLTPSGKKSWMRFAGMVDSTGSRGGREIDEVVYDLNG